ncbi:MAG: hypothetical protein HFE77_02100 [Clostridiales bacterium]|nr:hypothetical protein [Clostridiales bacterium]
MYYVDSVQKLGQGSFIDGIFAYAMIRSNGTICSIGIPNYDELEDFDTSRLDGFTKEAIESELGAKARELHGDEFVNCEFDTPRLMFVDGQYVLRCGVVSKIKDDLFEMYDGGQVYYYEIP